MELLLVPVPIFNKDMSVAAFLLRYHKYVESMPDNQGANMLDGVAFSPLLEVLNLVGVEAFAMEKSIFVPINSIVLLTNIQNQCNHDFDKIIFLIEDPEKIEEIHIDKILYYKSLGFKFALKQCDDSKLSNIFINSCDYLFCNQFDDHYFPDVINIKARNPKINIVASSVKSKNIFDGLSSNPFFSLFEGEFYRTPIAKSGNTVSPLKINLLKLMDVVQNTDFEFKEASDIIQRDAALTFSLMKMINSPFLGLGCKVKTINHAVTILGQREVRKWATVAVQRSLSADKPDEVTKTSLLRAKFAENLSHLFNLKNDSQSVFLTGLFSILDVVLEMPMKEILNIVKVADPIAEALISRSGKLAPAIKFVLAYESADWQAVSRDIIFYDISIHQVYNAYINAVLWYKDLITEIGEANLASV